MSFFARSTQERVTDRLRFRPAVGAIVAALVLAVAGCSSGSGSGTSTSAAPPTTQSMMPSASAPLKSSSNTESAMASSKGSAMSSATAMSGSSTYPADKQQLCTARDDLRTSVTALTDPTMLSQGAPAIGAALDKVQTNLDALTTAAQPELKPQLDAMQSAVQQLRTSVGNAGNGNVAQNLQNLVGDVTNVGTAATNLYKALDTACGS